MWKSLHRDLRVCLRISDRTDVGGLETGEYERAIWYEDTVHMTDHRRTCHRMLCTETRCATGAYLVGDDLCRIHIYAAHQVDILFRVVGTVVTRRRTCTRWRPGEEQLRCAARRIGAVHLEDTGWWQTVLGGRNGDGM